MRLLCRQPFGPPWTIDLADSVSAADLDGLAADPVAWETAGRAGPAVSPEVADSAQPDSEGAGVAEVMDRVVPVEMAPPIQEAPHRRPGPRHGRGRTMTAHPEVTRRQGVRHTMTAPGPATDSQIVPLPTVQLLAAPGVAEDREHQDHTEVPRDLKDSIRPDPTPHGFHPESICHLDTWDRRLEKLLQQGQGQTQT